jgi:hypothetical protein
MGAIWHGSSAPRSRPKLAGAARRFWPASGTGAKFAAPATVDSDRTRRLGGRRPTDDQRSRTRARREPVARRLAADIPRPRSRRAFRGNTGSTGRTRRRRPPRDAGAAAALARATGRTGSFELPTKPAEPWRSTDVGIRDDRHRVLILVECWNTFGDIGAAARSTNRKLAEAATLRRAIGEDNAYRVAGCLSFARRSETGSS